MVKTVRRTGLDATSSTALEPWRRPRAVHDPGKAVLDLALAVALAGKCLFGPAASDPTVSRPVDALAAAGPRALTAIRQARSEVRQRVWKSAGGVAPNAAGEVVVDIVGVLVQAPLSKAHDRASDDDGTTGHPRPGKGEKLLSYAVRHQRGRRAGSRSSSRVRGRRARRGATGPL